MICIVVFGTVVLVYQIKRPSCPTPLSKHLMPLQVVHLGTAVSPHDTLETILEPFDGLLLVYTVASPNLALGTSPLSYSLTGSRPVKFPVNISFISCTQHVCPKEQTYMQQ